MRRALFIATPLVTAAVLAGCGADAPKQSAGSSGSSAARRLLVQAFAGHQAINSGVIGLDLKVTPRGSASVSKPIELSFGGPFTTTGAGKPPASDFTIAIAANGHQAELQLISAGGKGYLTISGQSYRMPASSLKSLESGFGSLTAPGTSAKSGALTKLGIKPLDWLVDPRIVGSATVEGVKTTRIRARLDARALLSDLSRLLGKAGTLGIKSSSGTLPRRIPAATQSRIAQALGSPSVSIWTGAADKMLRKLSLTASLPISGSARQLLGGLRAATVTLVFEYSHLNQPQTITAPTATRPFSVLRSQLTTVLHQISGGLSNATGVAGNYTRCITAAAGDVAKMQKCSKLVGGG